MRSDVALNRCGGIPGDLACRTGAILAGCALTAVLLPADCADTPATNAGELIAPALAAPHRARSNSELDI